MANIECTCGRFGCISDEYGRVLLVQRGWIEVGGIKKWDGRWNYPGGGVDEEDGKALLTVEDIIEREVEEETGLRVILADHRPVGEYPTAKHTDIAITYLCKVIGGQLKTSEEGKDFRYVTPSEAVEMAMKGDLPDGLVGGFKTSTGGVPRHIQMILHFFTRVCLNGAYRKEAQQYCMLTFDIPT